MFSSLIVSVKCLVLFVLVFVDGESVSVAKCTEYQELCPSDSAPFNIEGELAAPKEFPYQASIGFQRNNVMSWPCAGTLISENFVLTAAHCMSNRFTSGPYVRLGELDFKTEGEGDDVRDFNVTETFFYPGFTNKSSYNDIALLKLDRNVDFNEYIQPACLPQLNTVISDKVIATGWGKTSRMGEQPSTLQKVHLNLVPFDVCTERYPITRRLEQGLSNETQLCAGSKEGERDTCPGFGGGPILNTGSKFSCLYEVVGITSLGISCGIGQPGVYTRLTAYTDWIENIVWPQD